MEHKRAVIIDPGMIGDSPAEKYLTDTLKNINDPKMVTKLMRSYNQYRTGLNKIHVSMREDPGFCSAVMGMWLEKYKESVIKSGYPELVTSLITNIMQSKYRMLVTKMPNFTRSTKWANK